MVYAGVNHVCAFHLYERKMLCYAQSDGATFNPPTILVVLTVEAMRPELAVLIS
jgi:hypothetical protein